MFVLSGLTASPPLRFLTPNATALWYIAPADIIAQKSSGRVTLSPKSRGISCLWAASEYLQASPEIPKASGALHLFVLCSLVSFPS